MTRDLAAFLAGRSPHHREEVRWGDIRLAFSLHISPEAPPARLITSVRSVVFGRGKVVVVDDSLGGSHVMPGGRIEPGETIAQTLAREVLEECGWTVLNPRPLAFGHFRHLGPKPDGYRYPYPDFLHLIFMGEAGEYRRGALKRAGEVETGSRLTTIPHALATITPDQQVLLKAALAARP
jgi:ADP-ribose pyrophosphatase YjhB (NUDIX family)